MRYILNSCLLLVLACGFTGCNSLKSKDGQWSPFTALNAEADVQEEFGAPVRMAVIWKDAVLGTDGKPNTQGFGGRVFLYDTKDQPVKAEGELIVYGFDDTINETKTNADRKYVFREAEFQNHYSDSGLGPSYSVWVPWQKIGGNQKTIALVPVFKTKDGRLLKGGHTISILPGKKSKTEKMAEGDSKPYKVLGHTPAVSNASVTDPGSKVVYSSEPTNKSSVSQASFDSYPEPNTSRIRSSTISVPPSMAERLNSLPRQDLSNVAGRFRRKAVPQTNATRAAKFSTVASDAKDDDSGHGKAWWSNPFSEKQQDGEPAFGKPGSFK